MNFRLEVSYASRIAQKQKLQERWRSIDVDWNCTSRDRRARLGEQVLEQLRIFKLVQFLWLFWPISFPMQRKLKILWETFFSDNELSIASRLEEIQQAVTEVKEFECRWKLITIVRFGIFGWWDLLCKKDPEYNNLMFFYKYFSVFCDFDWNLTRKFLLNLLIQTQFWKATGLIFSIEVRKYSF